MSIVEAPGSLLPGNSYVHSENRAYNTDLKHVGETVGALLGALWLRDVCLCVIDFPGAS